MHGKLALYHPQYGVIPIAVSLLAYFCSGKPMQFCSGVDSRPVRRRAPAIWIGNSNGTNGRVGVQNSSLSNLARWDWNLEKSIATGTHNSGQARGRGGLAEMT
jgi:hypothetical protein